MANPLDLMKMVRNYQKTQNMLKTIKAAGSSKDGTVAMLINGTMDIVQVEVEQGIYDLKETQISANILEAFKAAKKELEKQLRQNTSPDQLKEMMGM